MDEQVMRTKNELDLLKDLTEASLRFVPVYFESFNNFRKIFYEKTI